MWLNKITVAASDSLPMGDSGLGTGLKRQTGLDESVPVTPPKRIRAQLNFTPPKITKKTNQGGESAEPDYDFLGGCLTTWSGCLTGHIASLDLSLLFIV